MAAVAFGGFSIILGYAILNYFFPFDFDISDAAIVILGAVGGYAAYHYRQKK